MASFDHQALAAAPPEAVWRRLQDPETWATVAGVDTTSEHVHHGDRLTAFRFTTSVGGMTYRGTARVTEALITQRMTLTISTNELTGTITVALEERAPGTALMVGMRVEPVGMLGSVMFPAVRSAVSDGFTDSVERLAAAMT